MSETTLKPCPFCGHKQVRTGYYNDKRPRDKYVFCTKCFMEFNGCYRDREELIKAWNRRTP